MTPELTTLALRAVACKGWRWMPGMRGVRSFFHPTLGEHVTVNVRIESSLDVELIETPSSSQELVSSAHCTVSGWTKVSDLLPDLTDPATLGCLLALVREAWADPRIHAAPALYAHDAPPEYQYTISHWHVYSPGPYNPLTEPPKCAVTGKTEAEALVAALEAAP